MKYKNILLACCLCMALACKKKDIMIFEDNESGVYFQQGQIIDLANSELYTDSLYYSFSTAKNSLKDTVLKVRLRTMGKVKDYPRPVKLRVDESQTTAIAGKHYDMDLGAAVVPAGSGELIFSVKWHRTADLINKKFQLILKLEDNEHFKIYVKQQKNTNVHTSLGNQIAADKFKFIVSEVYTRPSYWSFVDGTYGSAYHTLGKWTVKKFNLVNELTGWSPPDWDAAGYPGSPVALGRFITVTLTVRNALQALADAGTPMLDDDGLPMQLGPDYQVTY